MQLLNGSLYAARYEYVGDTGVGAFAQTGGTGGIADSLFLGNSFGSDGTYNLSGSGLLSVQGTDTPDNYVHEFIGYSGAGTFTQSSGTNSIGSNSSGGSANSGQLQIGNDGYLAGGDGTYNLNGNGLLSANAVIMGNLGVSGTGVFNQTGGTINLDRGIEINRGTYSLGGSGLLSVSTVGEDLSSSGGSATFIQSGGSNAAVILYLGNAAGRNGTYKLSGNGLLTAAFEYVGYSGTGSFTQSGGTNSIFIMRFLDLGYAGGSGGAYDLNGGLLIVSGVFGGQGKSTFRLSGGTLQANENSTAFLTGLTATLVQSGGAIINVQGFNDAIGQSLLHDPALGVLADGGLVKSGSGLLLLAGANTYTGPTTVFGGKLALANALAVQYSTFDTSGSGTLSFGTLTAATFGGLTGPGKLSLSNSASNAVSLGVGDNGASTTFAGTLQGSGGLTKIGSGTLLLSGSNTYVGATAINQGELLVNGSLVSPMTVSSSGTLAGTGNISNVTVNSGGHLAPGNAPGTLTLSGSLALLSGAKMDYELDTPLDSDLVLMSSGALTLGGQQFSDFNFTPLGGFGLGSYTLIDAGSISGTLGNNLSGPIGNGLTGTLAIQGNDLVLSVVPEPGTLALLGGCSIALVLTSRLRRGRGKVRVGFFNRIGISIDQKDP